MESLPKSYKRRELLDPDLSFLIRPYKSISEDGELPQDIDCIDALFQPSPFPLTDSVIYSPSVPWLKNQKANLHDYSQFYKTSSHFISRSLHGRGKYLLETIFPGDRFNVLRIDKSLEFHLILDLSRLKVWAYGFDATENKRYFLKTYYVAAGKLDAKSPSGCLTPLGTFLLSDQFLMIKEGAIGEWKKEDWEMITLFGVRWLPLVKEISGCTGPAKGIGLHGIPWRLDPKTGKLVEYNDCIGMYDSLGCIRFLTEDIEELCSILTSRTSYIHIVKDFIEARLPGKEDPMVS